MDRFNRLKRRRQAVPDADTSVDVSVAVGEENAVGITSALIETASCEAESQTVNPFLCDASTQTLCDEVLKENILVKEQMQKLTKQLRKVSDDAAQQQHKIFGYHVIQHNNKLTKLYTGLPSYTLFLWLIEIMSSVFPETCLAPEDALLLTLMKLKLGVPFLDLSVRFNISETTATKLFGKMLNVMASNLKFLVYWPSRKAVKKHLPTLFKRHHYNGLVRSIIDCTEWFIERPKKLEARAQTWSTYKHHNTLKFLVSITPTGSISFVSKCWGGRVSDKKLTQESGYLEKIEQGDIVIADRGFLIEDELRVRGAKLLTPCFTKGKNQLSRKEVEMSRRLSRARIHVERAIARIKRFKILQIKLPLNLIGKCDSIVSVICALSNLLPPLIPKDVKE